MSSDAWFAGYESLRTRTRALPEIVRAALAEPPQPLGVTVSPTTGFVVTGVGSSAAHARLITHVLGEALRVRARFTPLGTFLEAASVGDDRDVLVVVSQGLSPNARLALRDRERWSGVVLLTATTVAGARRAGRDDTAELLLDLQCGGVEVRALPAGEDEFGTLVRVIGPLVGYLSALRFVDAVAAVLGRAAPVPPDVLACVPARLEAAPEIMAGLADGASDLVERLAGPIAFVTTGDYGSLVDNLRYKVLEGMLQPLPPVFDVLHLAHGPFQQFHDHPMTLLALTRATSPGESALLARVERMLVEDRHRLVRLPASLPAPLALFEHEALMNELMLRAIEAGGIDQIAWPGRGADGPLYDVSDAIPASSVPEPGEAARLPRQMPRRLELLTWPEVAGLLASEPLTAVLPLGSTEQHGRHLPFATDTRIAEALGLRFCARVPEALLLPALPVGCASEHMGFPGTLDVRTGTLEAILVDLVTSLRTHGFARTFVFSAHGGNVPTLAQILPELRRAGAPMLVGAQTDLAGLTALWHETSAVDGIAAEIAGHHAGEFETSIVRALWPGAVREGALAPGHVMPVPDAQALFYPSLASRVPSGTVGDPRPADDARGARYLDAWASLLVSTYQLEKKSA